MDKRHPNKIYEQEKEKAKNKAAWESFTDNQVKRSQREVAEYQKKNNTGCLIFILLPTVAITISMVIKIYFS